MYHHNCMYYKFSAQKRAMCITYGKTHPNKTLTIPKFNTHFENLHVIPQIAANSPNHDVIFKCSNCEKVFQDFNLFKSHVRKNHKE